MHDLSFILFIKSIRFEEQIDDRNRLGLVNAVVVLFLLDTD